MDHLRLPFLLLLFDNVGISITQGEIDIEVSEVPWDLFKESTFLFPNIYDVFIGCPIALYPREPLLEEKRQILCFVHRHDQDLDA